MDVGRIELNTNALTAARATLPTAVTVDNVFDPQGFVVQEPAPQPSAAIAKATETAEKLLDVLADIAEYPNSAAQTQAIAAALNAITAFLSVQRR